MSVTAPQLQSSAESESDSDADSGSDAESERTHPSPSASDFTVKPIVSKPMDDRSEAKKPVTKPGARRPAETDLNGKESAKKRKKVMDGDEDGGEVTGKKGPGIQRLWSEDDEIVILKGMLDYHLKKGIDPYSDMGEFLEFIRNSLHVDVNKNQLMDKVRRLKKKYQNNTEKGDNGEDPVFSKLHDVKSFDLSKKIWGGLGSNKTGAADDHDLKNKRWKSKNSGNVNSKSVLALSKQEAAAVKREASNGEYAGELKDVKRDNFWSLYPYMSEAVESGLVPDSIKSFVKNNMSLIGGSKAKELEGKWEKMKVDEIKLYLKQVILVEETTRLVLDAMKSSSTS